MSEGKIGFSPRVIQHIGCILHVGSLHRIGNICWQIISVERHCPAPLAAHMQLGALL